MGKVNRTGRSKTEGFIRLHRGVTNSEAWKSITCEARALLLEVWARHNGQNNGAIPYSQREARKALRIGSRKVGAAFSDVQDRGFLIARCKGSFDWKAGASEGRATEWEITAEPCDGKPAKRLYRDWPKKQNAGTTVGADGHHRGRRSPTNHPTKPDIGNHSGARYVDIQPSNGTHRGHTYNLPSAAGAKPPAGGKAKRPQAAARNTGPVALEDAAQALVAKSAGRRGDG